MEMSKNDKKLAKEMIDELLELKGKYPPFNDVINIVQNNKYDNIYEQTDFWYFARDWGIWDSEQMDLYCQENEHERLIYFLKDVEYHDEFYYIDGYENATNLHSDMIETFIDEYISRIKTEYEIELK